MLHILILCFLSYVVLNYNQSEGEISNSTNSLLIQGVSVFPSQITNILIHMMTRLGITLWNESPFVTITTKKFVIGDPLVEVDLQMMTPAMEDSLPSFEDVHFEYQDLLKSDPIEKGDFTPDDFNDMCQKAKDVFSDLKMLQSTNALNDNKLLNAIVQDIARRHEWKLRIEHTTLIRKQDDTGTPVHLDGKPDLILWILLDEFIDRFTLAFEYGDIWVQPEEAFFGHAVLFMGQEVWHASFDYCHAPPCLTEERSAMAVSLVFDYPDQEQNERMMRNGRSKDQERGIAGRKHRRHRSVWWNMALELLGLKSI